MPDEYGSMQVAEAAGIGYQRLWRWYQAGAIAPTTDNGRRRRLWSELDRDVLTDIGAVDEDLAGIDMQISYELVSRLWDACHDDPDADIIELDCGSITITVDRRERRALDAVPVRRGLEEE